MLYTAADLNIHFPSSYLTRGRQYRKQHRVRYLAVTEQGRMITARVTGNRPEPYGVAIRITPNNASRAEISGTCTCPIGYNCKHVVATLLQALEGDMPTPRWVQADIPPPEPEPVLSPTLNLWFQRLNKAVDEHSEPQNRERILYLLAPNPDRGVRVAIVAGRILKTGAYGKTRSYQLQNALKHPAQFLSTLDRTILRDMALKTWGSQDCLEGSDGAVLLEHMLNTGRCYWESKDNPPLQKGEERSTEPQWITDNQGLTRLQFRMETPGAQVLPLTPLWYIDPEQHLCGPAATTLTPALATALATSPNLTPEEIPRVQSWLARHLPEAQLPPLPKLRITLLADVKPQPILKLYSRNLEALYYGSPVDTINGANLSFDYGGSMMTLDDSAQEISHYAEGRVVRMARNLAAESFYLRSLRTAGLRDLVHCYPAYLVPRECSGDLGLLDPDNWLDFMLKTVPQLRKRGWSVEITPSFEYDLVEADAWYAELDQSSGIDWFSLALGVEVEGERVNLLPALVDYLRKLPAKSPRQWLDEVMDGTVLTITLPSGRLLPLPVERVRDILRVLIELYDDPGLDLHGNLKLPRVQAGRLDELETVLQGDQLRWQGGKALRELAERLRRSGLPQQVTVPSGLRAHLRPYQEQGLAWLRFLGELELSGILADDMGLGKTVQALAHILAEQDAGRLDQPCLVVAPTSLMVNWRQEAERFAPNLKILTLRGPDRHKHFADIPDYHLVLTTYALLPRDEEALAAHSYHLLILDEAQAIKNPRAQAGQVARGLKTRLRLCLTGTPMENHLGDLWSLFDFLMPGLLGDERQFRRLFRRPIEQHADTERRERLIHRIAPFMLRRTKEQVASELPEKTEIIRTVELSGSQRDLYEGIRYAMQDKVRQTIQRMGLARSHIVILEALLKLRQVCCDPRLLKLDSARKVKQSAKLQLLLELLPELVEEGRRILLFSQFTTMLGLIEPELKRLKIDYVKLTGQTRDRAIPVERFQAGQVPLFIISLKAGGVGLNLTAADTVIHYDPWWNPAVEDQATDRAHRIGQDKPVFVYKLYTEATVEEKIRTLQTRKRNLIQGVLKTDGDSGPQWTENDLEFLLAPLE